MLTILCLFFGILFLALSILTWEQGARGWWVWLIPSVILFFVYASGIQS